MAVFKAFKPEAMNKIAKAMGYSGDMGQFQSFIEQDPARQARMQQFTNAAVQMAKGGVVKMQTGGGVQKVAEPMLPPDYYLPGAYPPGTPMSEREINPKYRETPYGGFQQTGGTPIVPDVTPEGPIGGGLTPQNTFGMQPMSAQQQQEARDFVAAGGVPQMPNFTAQNRGFTQYTNAGNTRMAVPLNLQQAAPNFTGMTPVMNDPRGQAINLLTGEMAPQENYLKGSKEQYDAFRKQYMQGGPRIETADVRMHPMQGFDFQGSSTEFGAFQDYLRGQQQAMDPRTAQQTPPPAATPPAAQAQQTGITEATMQRMFTPGLPQGGQVTAATTPLAAGQMVDPRVGAVAGGVAVPTAMAGVQQAAATQEQEAAQMQAAQAAPAVNTALQANQAAQTTLDPRAEVTAAQQTASSVGDVTAAQGNAVLIDNPVQRNIQAGELITGASADAATAAQFTEQVQAAEATPSTQATVQGQLAQLTANFDAANPPAWAAGALRSATAQMAARGLGASSLAGQAIVQATIEAALPIAQADATVTAQFEAQNLSNRQQRAMLAAQQRAQFMGQEFDQAFQARVQNAAKVSDVANQNFTAEQQVQLENSRIANTANLTNLSNKQALVMAEAASLAQLDTQNLNNRQQSAVQNAQNFLQVDMANLSNRQQTDLFNAQQRVQSLFTDQAAENASRQFNASSQNQVDQFFANLASQTSQFNASQVNAQSQFNAGQRNTLERFNAELNNQRDQFNAQNQLVIAQSNAQWRREIATADTAAVNRANELNANAILDIGNQAYANLWNYYADTMEWAWTSAENQIDRTNALAIAELDAAARKAIAGEQASSAAGTAIGSLIGTLGSAWIMCWVAREVYGKQNVHWFIFRAWLQYDAPKWFRKLYKKHGKTYAKFIAKVPPLKWATKALMDLVVERKKRKHHVSCAY
jgi:hypothetical protein